MKNIKNISLLLVLSALCFSGCKKNNEDENAKNPTLDDVSLPSAPIEEYSHGGTAILPGEGDEATSPLTISTSYTYFDNKDLHSLSGQWSGYGVHTPFVLKHNGVYYMYQSTPKTNIGIKAFKSYDLINWDYVTEAGFTSGYISKDRQTYAASSPRVYFYNDLFYLIFNTPNGYKVYTSTSPEGEFVYLNDLNFASKYNASIFIAPNGKLFLVSGGEKAVELYEMKSFIEVNQSSRVVIDSTAIDAYQGQSYETTSPSISLIDGVAYLTYSSVDESFKSYRSYLVSAVNPDFSNTEKFANSFFNQHQGPILINTNGMNGDVSLGDLSLIEGPDMVSYYAMYTSLESSEVRRFNLAPISYSGANLAFAHRNKGEVNDVKATTNVTLSGSTKLFGEEETGNIYTAYLSGQKVKEYYFSYRSINNHFVISLNNEIATLTKKENGLETELSKVSIKGEKHSVKIIANDKKITVFIDNLLLVDNYECSLNLSGKLGYLLLDGGVVLKTSFVNTTSLNNQRLFFKQAESSIFAKTYLAEYSHFTNSEPLKLIGETYSDFFGSYYLDFSNYKDYARFLVDVPENGRYGVELVFNTAFAKYRSTVGLRVGSGNELLYQLNELDGQGYARTLTAEFDVTKGANEVFIENMSNNQLKLVSVRLVKVSSGTPDYHNSLATFANQGIYYETDFSLNEQYGGHEVFEGAKMFAYVGDNSITDFTLSIQLAFLYSQSISGHIALGFRCDNFASSSKDYNDSFVGYYLEISQYQVKLMKYQYGYNLTLGIANLVNSIGDISTYKISMVANKISIYKDGSLVFSVIDQFAFSSGHLGFGSEDTNAVIRNLNVTKGE